MKGVVETAFIMENFRIPMTQCVFYLVKKKKREVNVKTKIQTGINNV